jgi:hypothetical protein
MPSLYRHSVVSLTVRSRDAESPVREPDVSACKLSWKDLGTAFPERFASVVSFLAAASWKAATVRGFIPAILGLFLITTAVLKIQGPADGALGQNVILFSPRIQFVAAELEMLIGLWLLSGWAKRAAWLACIAFFLALAATSLYLGLMGQSSCGCFGRIEVSPWKALGLDLACLIAMAIWRPALRAAAGAAHPRWRREALAISGGSGALLAVGLGVVQFVTERPGDLLARLRGEAIAVEPAVVDLGTDLLGKVHRFTVQIHNHSDRSIRIIGGTSNCSCMAIDDLPVLILAHETVSVSAVTAFKGTAGMFQNEFIFYTDDEQQNQVVARVKGRIVDSSNK